MVLCTEARKQLSLHTDDNDQQFVFSHMKIILNKRKKKLLYESFIEEHFIKNNKGDIQKQYTDKLYNFNSINFHQFGKCKYNTKILF